MKHVISILGASLEVMTTNEPINRQAGNTEQADLEAETAAEIRHALTKLEEKEPSDFGWAVRHLKAGRRVRRLGWNGLGMFVFMQVPSEIGADIVPRMTSLPQPVKDAFVKRDLPLRYSNQLALVKADNSINGWAPSAADALAEDWEVIDE